MDTKAIPLRSMGSHSSQASPRRSSDSEDSNESSRPLLSTSFSQPSEPNLEPPTAAQPRSTSLQSAQQVATTSVVALISPKVTPNLLRYALTTIRAHSTNSQLQERLQRLVSPHHHPTEAFSNRNTATSTTEPQGTRSGDGTSAVRQNRPDREEDNPRACLGLIGIMGVVTLIILGTIKYQLSHVEDLIHQQQSLMEAKPSATRRSHSTHVVHGSEVEGDLFKSIFSDTNFHDREDEERPHILVWDEGCQRGIIKPVTTKDTLTEVMSMLQVAWSNSSEHSNIKWCMSPNNEGGQNDVGNTMISPSQMSQFLEVYGNSQIYRLDDTGLRSGNLKPTGRFGRSSHLDRDDAICSIGGQLYAWNDQPDRREGASVHD